MRPFAWLLRAFIFFTLFAFALNNQQTATVHWFFGVEWQVPLVILVLVVFAIGCAIGVVAMLPSWWRHRRSAMRYAPEVRPAERAPSPADPSNAEPGPEHPPREGL